MREFTMDNTEGFDQETPDRMNDGLALAKKDVDTSDDDLAKFAEDLVFIKYC